ncbi:olfactory receptor 1G1-like [Tachyglossus aculeatus]|uniref:olfactory receptor 1G1-like n=1 Tax=Tachyglossus aculeatus TaxID=9261 RepID=UPI0018F42D67|nr:olfactory receptor 1G1-like [Tachyglossus aculeatus]
MKNITAVMEFLLLVFSEVQELQVIHTTLLLLVYLTALLGNFPIVAMTLDRYEGVMNRGACVKMADASWLSGGLSAALHTASTFSFSFCGSNAEGHFFCDIPSYSPSPTLLTTSGSYAAPEGIIPSPPTAFALHLCIWHPFSKGSFKIWIDKKQGEIQISEEMSNHNAVMEFLDLGFSEVFIVLFSLPAELFLLTEMFFDLYVAICHSLCYDVIMDRWTCEKMAAASWLFGSLAAVIHIPSTFSLSFYGSNHIHLFFCDIPQLLLIYCSQGTLRKVAPIIKGIVPDFWCFLGIDVSYTCIFSAVLKMITIEGRSKAFATCLPHLGGSTKSVVM